MCYKFDPMCHNFNPRCYKFDPMCHKILSHVPQNSSPMHHKFQGTLHKCGYLAGHENECCRVIRLLLTIETFDLEYRIRLTQSRTIHNNVFRRLVTPRINPYTTHCANTKSYCWT
jgi:hypothetical protein